MHKYEKACIFCNKTFITYNDEYSGCYDCFKFFSRFGGIKDFTEFLEAFELHDNQEAKEEYIRFVDSLKKFSEIRGDWKVDKILQNPGEFLDKVKIGTKRKKK